MSQIQARAVELVIANDELLHTLDAGMPTEQLLRAGDGTDSVRSPTLTLPEADAGVLSVD